MGTVMDSLLNLLVVCAIPGAFFWWIVHSAINTPDNPYKFDPHDPESGAFTNPNRPCNKD